MNAIATIKGAEFASRLGQKGKPGRGFKRYFTQADFRAIMFIIISLIKLVLASL